MGTCGGRGLGWISVLRWIGGLGRIWSLRWVGSFSWIGSLGRIGVVRRGGRVRRGGVSLSLVIAASVCLVRLGDGDGLLAMVIDTRLVDSDGRVGNRGIVVVFSHSWRDSGVFASMWASDCLVLDDGLGLRVVGLVRGVRDGSSGWVLDVSSHTAVGNGFAGRSGIGSLGGYGRGLLDSNVRSRKGVSSRLVEGGGRWLWSAIGEDMRVRVPLSVLVLLDLHRLVVLVFPKT